MLCSVSQPLTPRFVLQIPTIGFLYVAGYIGSVGRDYLTRIKAEAKPRDKEIIIDVPLALKCSLAGVGWPAKAISELRNGTLTEDDVRPFLRIRVLGSTFLSFQLLNLHMGSLLLALDGKVRASIKDSTMRSILIVY